MTHGNSPQAYHVHNEPGEAGAVTPSADSRAQERQLRVSSPEVNVVREALSDYANMAWHEWQHKDADKAALAALDSLLAYIKQLEALQEGYYVDAQQQRERAEAAERENERLREALEAIAERRVPTTFGGGWGAAVNFARAALAVRTEEQA